MYGKQVYISRPVSGEEQCASKPSVTNHFSSSAPLRSHETMAVIKVVFLVMAAVLVSASAATQKTQEAEEKENKGRFFINTYGMDGEDQTSLTVGYNNIILGGLLLAGLAAIVIFFTTRQNDYKELPQAYSEPAHYSAPAEETYAIHRHLKVASDKYDQ
ncbi:uncharacterized protein LOC127001543 [Eriocheir sinensis]|uniref:uncharacterized protein LOC127001543 n=1 Tax=Eriocheir sinensis TaxID=95602 RepID=UPI0021CA0878|nr:uncharacterized protein LOC127001543 [Eriocheir sinensis]